MGVVGPDLTGTRLGRMTVTGAAQREQALGRETVRTEWKLELSIRCTAPGRFHVRPSRAVTAFARYVGNQCLLVNRLVGSCGSLGRMASETLPSFARGVQSPVRSRAWRPCRGVLAGSQSERLSLRIVGDSMFQDRRDSRIEDIHEGRGVVPGAERVFDDTFFDLTLGLAGDVQLSVAVSVVPGDLGVLGIGDRLPVQLARGNDCRPPSRSGHAPIGSRAADSPV